jgi:hypothetical protein
VHCYKAVSQAIATQTVFCEAGWFVRDDLTRRLLKQEYKRRWREKRMITQRSRGTGSVVLCPPRAPGVEVIAPADLPRSMATAESGARNCGETRDGLFSHARSPANQSRASKSAARP